ncbi:hypothetical protein MTX20_26245 [Bradyrhizobium sp. ISRA435]|nr:hypothetical protein MTX20_26245 [Bradyrhizobium sp. ISRA435]
MVTIAEPVTKPGSRFRYILDRRGTLGAVFVAPAILYVLLLVGGPFLLAVYYSVSAYTIYDPSWRFVGPGKFRADYKEPGVSRDAGQHVSLHVWIAAPGTDPWQVRCVLADAAVRRSQDRQGVDHIALGRADRAGLRRLGVDV